MQYTQNKKTIKICLRASDAANTVKNNNTCRFTWNLNGALNHVKLSIYAKIELEACVNPSLSNFFAGYIILETPSETIFYDSRLSMSGGTSFPIIGVVSDNSIIYRYPIFSPVSIGPHFLNNPIVIRLESFYPSTTTVDWKNIDQFFVSLIITDVEDEQTQDNNLAPEVKFEKDVPRKKPLQFLP